MVLEKKVFLCFSYFHDEDCKSVGAPWAGSFLTPGAWLAGFIKRTTIHCYVQSMKALGLVVSENNFFPMMPPRRGLYEPQGHGWQDL